MKSRPILIGRHPFGDRLRERAHEQRDDPFSELHKTAHGCGVNGIHNGSLRRNQLDRTEDPVIHGKIRVEYRFYRDEDPTGRYAQRGVDGMGDLGGASSEIGRHRTAIDLEGQTPTDGNEPPVFKGLKIILVEIRSGRNRFDLLPDALFRTAEGSPNAV